MRILPLVLLLSSGCYLSHGPTDGAPAHRDGGAADGHVDGAFFDGGPFFDSGLDAGFDGGFDGGADAEPPDLPPPVPGRCRTTPDIEPFRSPVLEYRWPMGPVLHRSAIHVCDTPLVIDLEPEGDEIDPQLVFVSYPPLSRDVSGGILRIVHPRTNDTISYPATEAEPGVLESTTNLAAGDIDGDGRNEIVGIGVVSSTYAFRSDGTLLWESPYPTARDRGTFPITTFSGAVALADLEGDGTVEVIIGHNVIDGETGAHRWTGGTGTGNGVNQFLGPMSCVADLDGDGIQEVVAGFTAFRANGDIYWSNPSAQDGFCAIADSDPSPGPEVILVSNGYIRVLNGHTGEQIWRRGLEGRVILSMGGAPTVGDFDGDGDIEFGVANGAAYGVYDPSCRAAGDPVGCQGAGLLWNDPDTSDDSSSGTGSAVFDFNGDGRVEVVYNDQYYFRVYDGRRGRVLFEFRNSSRTRTENPTIADFDNDGDAEIIFSANAEANFIRMFWTDPGVEVWGDRRGRWVGSRRIYNQHTYHVTNVEEDGTIASPEADSWTVLNGYRQNVRQDGDVLATPDLWGGRGTFECLSATRARLTINVQNWGLERVGIGARVVLYRGRPTAGGVLLEEKRTTTVLEPEGGSERVTFDVMVTSTREDYYAVLDPPDEVEGGSIGECREDNNEVLVWHVACP